MTESQYSLFLSVGALLCAMGAALNLVRIKRRGSSAYILASAFLSLGALLWMLKAHAEQIWVNVLGSLVAILLIADVIVRSRNQERPR